MLPEAGHLNPTFPLARMLSARGHEIVYTSLPDLEHTITDRGFGFVPLHGDYVPRGRLAQIEAHLTQWERDLAWEQIRDRVTMEDYFSGRIEKTVRMIDPSIILADVVAVSPMQFIAHRLKLPCLQLSTSLSHQHHDLPPLSCSLPMDTTAVELAAAQWEATSLRTFGTIPCTELISSAIDAYCARFAYPRRLISFASDFWPSFTAFPEAVLCAAAVDYPGQTAVRPTYLATPVELDRREEVSDSLQSFVSSASSLIYASLGSQPGRYPGAQRFFFSLLEVMQARPDLRAVIATGPKYFSNPVFANVPANVLIVQTAPQLWLLRRSALFITHGGLGSVREAIAMQVPMIVVPQQHDQPGNAARVVHHKLGIHLDPDHVTGNSLAACVERVLEHKATYKRHLKSISEATLAEEAENRCVKFIEQLAAHSGRAVPGASSSHTSKAPHQPSSRGWIFAGGLAAVAAFRAGAVLQDSRSGAAVAAGRIGFTIYPNVVSALSRATGALLAHVEISGDLVEGDGHVTGRYLHCIWSLDVGELLYDFASWCAHRALQSQQIREPETVAAFSGLIDEFHAHRRNSVSIKEAIRVSVDLFASAARIWNRGYGAVSKAVKLTPHIAAQFARLYAINALLRVANAEVTDTAHDAADCDKRYEAITDEFDAEFERRIAEHLRKAKLLH
jgi:MGT family glycosyltransferase